MPPLNLGFLRAITQINNNNQPKIAARDAEGLDARLSLFRNTCAMCARGVQKLSTPSPLKIEFRLISDFLFHPLDE